MTSVQTVALVSFECYGYNPLIFLGIGILVEGLFGIRGVMCVHIAVKAGRDFYCHLEKRSCRLAMDLNCALQMEEGTFWRDLVSLSRP